MSSTDNPTNAQDDATAEAFAQAAETLASKSQAAGNESNELLKLKAERDSFYEQSLRANAELENFRKRMRREMEDAARYQYLPLIRDILPCLDNLNRTIQSAEASGNIESLLQGLRMTVKQFDDVFARNSAKPIATVGEPFDANVHEALTQIPTKDKPPMTVLQEIERGYVLHERVIRPAKVIVSSELK